MARLKDVAQAAGVSTATVSNVLRGTKATTPEVQQRVRDAIERLGYLPNPHAQSLRTGHSRTLGVVVPDLTNPFFPALVQAIETTSRAHGYALLVMDAGNDVVREAESLALMSSYRVAGVIWVPVGDDPRVAWPFPIVTVDRPVAGRDAVVADHAQGGALIARHAIALGHRRIGMLAGPRALPSAALRREGFYAAADSGLHVAWEHEVPFSSDLPAAVRARLRQPDCSLVVCANDAVAVGVLRALREAGIGVPDDVSVIGFDDVPWAEFIDPALTTVRQPVAVLGAEAVTMLVDRIAKPGAPPSYWTLEVELVVRRSAAAVGRHANADDADGRGGGAAG
jgi:LacI family transcriptional regulator